MIEQKPKKFSENLKICIYAKKNKVNVLIENNVITKKFKSFKDDPFLHPIQKK